MFLLKKSIQCFKHSISNSSNTNNAHTANLVCNFFLESNCQLSPRLKKVWITRHRYNYSSSFIYAINNVKSEARVLAKKIILARIVSPNLYLLIAYLVRESTISSIHFHMNFRISLESHCCCHQVAT